MATPLRINKALASHLGIGRRQADILIDAGRVQLNGEPVAQGQRVTPGDEIRIDGKLISLRSPELVYLVFHKPAGYVCSRRQQGETPTIYSLLPKKYHHLQPVGRLDKDSSGLLLLTNDGDFALHMTHPKFAKVKRYEVTLDHALQPLHRQMIAGHGVELPDGPSRLQLERMSEGNERKWVVTMQEGRNRQIRRTFAALGYEVQALHRIQFGPYELDGLQAGVLDRIDKK